MDKSVQDQGQQPEAADQHGDLDAVLDDSFWDDDSVPDAGETATLARLRARAEATRAAASTAAAVELARLTGATADQRGRAVVAAARRCYVLDRALRDEVVLREAVLSAAECARIVAAAEASARRNGAPNILHPTTTSCIRQ
eukprot:SAG11_NODE_90_length_17153_cov_63.471033_10_plen_142_part_00